MDETRERALEALISFFGLPKAEDVHIFDVALIHDSYAKEARDRGIECMDNERLEFLGDRVLSLFLAEMLYKDTDLPEGKMNDRMAIISDRSLARIARGINGFPALVLVGKSVKEMEDAILAGALEAFTGAVFLTYGCTNARAFVGRLLSGEVLQFQNENYIGRLGNECSKRHGRAPEYFVEEHDGFRAIVRLPDGKEFEGKGKSKAAARMDAARRALSYWGCK